MNLSDQDFEKELAAMKPVAPGRHLQRRIEAELETNKRKEKSRLIRLWPILPFAIAACLILAVSLHYSDRSGNSQSDGLPVASISGNTDKALEPVEAKQILVQAFDEGVVTNDEAGPVRRFRYEFIDTVKLVDPSDGSVFTMQVPREEVLLVPVTLL
ncbi:MAG: hypothetical protein KJT03_17770 [Verrucomicrobiae bacterium]|nr:hypothetical protein [Verrucomicrobiae bacterium]